MADADYDWSFFDVYMDIRAPIEGVFDAWATAAGMERFFVRTWVASTSAGGERAGEERSEVGDSFTAAFHHPLEFAGRVLEAEAPGRFAFTFGPMQVAVTLHEHEGVTRVHVRQSNIATDPEGMVMQHMNCRSCWVYYLMNLKSVLEHGADLRDGDRPIADNIISIPFHDVESASSGG